MNNTQRAALLRLFFLLWFTFVLWLTNDELARYNNVLFLLAAIEIGVIIIPSYKNHD
jgi:hypothetical protein